MSIPEVVKKNLLNLTRSLNELTGLCFGLDNKIDPDVIAQKVIKGIYDGISTKELDNLAAETAAYLSTQHPDYATLAGRIAVSNLHKETKDVFRKHQNDV